MNKLSIHRPSKRKNFTHEALGYYLAGLVDADGHISTIGHIVISFNIRDIRDAYRLRSDIGYGKIRKVKDKNAINLIISNQNGVKYFAKLIHNKLKHPDKIKQYNSRLYHQLKLVEDPTSLDTTINWNSFWFSGFCDGDGYLRLYILKRPHRERHEVRILCQIDQKDDLLLKQIKKHFGGYIGYRKELNTFYYSTVSFKGMYRILKYFDQYSPYYNHLYLRYTILRKAYILVQKREHLTEKGIKKLFAFKQTLKDMI